MKFDYAVHLYTCCICGCTVHTPRRLDGGFLQATETCPNSKKEITTCQDLKNAEKFQLLVSSTGFGPTLTTMTKLLAGWPAILTQMSAGFPATVCRFSNLCSGHGVVKVFVAFKVFPFSPSYLLTARKISVFLMVLARCSSCNRLHSLFP